MNLITRTIAAQLLGNGQATRQAHAELRAEPDHLPVVKFFDPCGAATWLITECDPSDADRLFGLVDLGLGFPELGEVSLRELQTLRGKLGLPIERDRHFTPGKTLSEYADEARRLRRIKA